MTDIPFLIPLKTYRDNRGWFAETMNLSHLISEYKIAFIPVQENTSMSKKDVVRGFHYQIAPYEQAKLLQVVTGSIIDVCIDVRPGPTYGTRHLFRLDSNSNCLLYIPKGYAHGFSVLADDTVVSYKTDAFYSKEHERSFNPFGLGIDWCVQNPIISEKDRTAPVFN